MNDYKFQQTTLPDGLRVLTERHAHVPSATIGVWIVAGSVYEKAAESGMAHLLEHMVFKGTESRTMHQIAVEMDSVGGQTNAFTEREFVCYHAKVLAEHLPIAMDLLCELVTSPTLDEADLELEKGVILEEIKSVEDAPEELVEELFTQTIWPRSRWGRSILGTPQSVSNLQVSDVRSFLHQHYSPTHVLVAAVGDVQHEDIVARAEKLLSSLPGARRRSAHQPPRTPQVQAHRAILSRDNEQVQICCGTQAPSARDDDRFPAYLLDAILTGGYSSRLFQEIREKRGLCYNIGGMSASYRHDGFWAVETGVALTAAERVLDLIGRELRRLKTKGVTRRELQRAQQMTRANLLLSEESSSAQMGRIARNELYYGCQRGTDEVLKQVMAVTTDDLQRVANQMFDARLMNLAVVGPFGDDAPGLQIDVG